MLTIAFKPPPRIKKLVALSPPSCNDCKYFENGTCKLFFTQSLSGKIVYAQANKIRLDPRFCGLDGKYYLKK